jgi:hypothetical protein
MTEAGTRYIKTLLYFDVFDYPLTRRELIDYTCPACQPLQGEQDVDPDHILNQLVMDGFINQLHGYYYVGASGEKINKRNQGNARAQYSLCIARRYAKLIATCPFVRGVYISGSLSKFYMDSDDDIDYFIVTAPGRMWFARTMLILFKKLFLLNSHKHFCLNYFIDSDHLEIEERNLYVATELVFLLPMYNAEMLSDLRGRNDWVRMHYPEFEQTKEHLVQPVRFLKWIMESLFGHSLADSLEKALFKHSVSYIRRKYAHIGAVDFSRHFSLDRHVIRYFPHSHHNNTLQTYAAKMLSYEQEKGIILR